MQIKIKGKNAELLQENLTAVLNIATVVAQRGHIPTPVEIATPEQRGRYWYLNGRTFHLAGIANDFLANIREEGSFDYTGLDNNSASVQYIVLEFSYRYDRGYAFFDALTNLIAARFRDDVEIV